MCGCLGESLGPSASQSPRPPPRVEGAQGLESRLPMELHSPVPITDEMSAKLILQPMLAHVSQIRGLRPGGTGDLLVSP